eukprot:1990894-Alexandrium_andersonii.AAC.1
MARAISFLGIGRMTASVQSASSWAAKYPSTPTPARSVSDVCKRACTSPSAGPETFTTSS